MTPAARSHLRQLASALGECVDLVEYVLCSNKVCICGAAERHLGEVLNKLHEVRDAANKASGGAQ
jgi:hypothetical protein